MDGGTLIRRGDLVADRQQVEQRRRHSEGGEADKNDCDHRVPNEVRVASQRRYHVLASSHGPMLPWSFVADHAI
jgi:hypothetical protein